MQRRGPCPAGCAPHPATGACPPPPPHSPPAGPAATAAASSPPAPRGRRQALPPPRLKHCATAAGVHLEKLAEHAWLGPQRWGCGNRVCGRTHLKPPPRLHRRPHPTHPSQPRGQSSSPRRRQPPAHRLQPREGQARQQMKGRRQARQGGVARPAEERWPRAAREAGKQGAAHAHVSAAAPPRPPHAAARAAPPREWHGPLRCRRQPRHRRQQRGPAGVWAGGVAGLALPLLRSLPVTAS